MNKLKLNSYLLMAINLIACVKSEENTNDFKHCRPAINSRFDQFVIGYASLMQEKSKREETSAVSVNYPIEITGFKRGWIEHGTPIGFSTTYLGVRPEANAIINAVYFKLNNKNAIYNYDKREDTYCRLPVSRQQIKSLTNKKLPKGEYWIYATTLQQAQQPSSKYPIVQSYLDIFLSGCLQIEEKYHLTNFAKNCIQTTGYWSSYWVNDRVNPRTAYDNDPYVAKIDPLLATELPYYFPKIRLE